MLFVFEREGLCFFFAFFFFQAEDGIRYAHLELEFRRVLFRSSSMQVYSALPGFFSLSTELATSLRRKSRTFAPCRSTTVMCETSNMPASRRTWWCSSICEP